MPVTAEEKFESRLITTGNSPSAELRYVIRGTNDDVQARSALAAAAPGTFDLNGNGLFFLPRDSLSIEPVGDQLWEGVARYSNTAAKALVKRPIAVYVEQVYPYGDLNALGI